MEMQNPAPPPKNSSFSPDIMGQLQKEYGPAKEMPTQDIIRTEFENNGTGMDWKQVYANIEQLVQQPNYRILRAGNSLLVVRNDGNGNAYVLMASADRPKDMAKNMKEFLQALQKANFKKVSFDTPRPAIIKLIQSTGFNVQSNMGKMPEPNSGKPSIHVEVGL
jgi:hypothetical protein